MNILVYSELVSLMTASITVLIIIKIMSVRGMCQRLQFINIFLVLILDNNNDLQKESSTNTNNINKKVK